MQITTHPDNPTREKFIQSAIKIFRHQACPRDSVRLFDYSEIIGTDEIQKQIGTADTGLTVNDAQLIIRSGLAAEPK